LFRSHLRHLSARLGAALGLLLAAAIPAVAAHAAPVHSAPTQGPSTFDAKPFEVDRTGGVASVELASSLEQELLQRLNALRAKAGLRPLRKSRALTSAAVSHSRSMAKHGYFSHESYDGSAFWQRVGRFYKPPQGFRVYRVGENLLSGPDSVSAASVIRGWLESAPHRRNLYAGWGEVGVGAVRAVGAPGIFAGASVLIVTADFGERA
jgi:uncharacterized protein YkwD